MSMLKLSAASTGGPLSHAFTVKCAVLLTPWSKNGPTASNSAPLLGTAQAGEVERNPVNELALNVFPLASKAENLPCTPDPSDMTSKVKVIIPQHGMVPVLLSSPVCCGGGWFQACSFGLSGSRASLHAAARASSAAAAADAPREIVGFMGAPSWSNGVWEPMRQNADPVSRAQQRAATAPDAAHPHRPMLHTRGVARELHHDGRALPERSMVAIVSASPPRSWSITGPSRSACCGRSS